MGQSPRPTESAETCSVAWCSSPWSWPWYTSASMDISMETSALPTEPPTPITSSVENQEELQKLSLMPTSTTLPLSICRTGTVSRNAPTSAQDHLQHSTVTVELAHTPWQLTQVEHTQHLPAHHPSSDMIQLPSLEESVSLQQLSLVELSQHMCLLSAPTSIKMAWAHLWLTLKM